jgi:hypothetical protein
MSVTGAGLDESTKWSRSGFKDTFKRGRKNTQRRDSDSNSSTTLERIIPTLDGRRRSSTESSSALKKVLSGGRRGRLGKNDSNSSLTRPEISGGSNEPFRGFYNNSSTEGPLGAGSEDAANFTEDENEDP